MSSFDFLQAVQQATVTIGPMLPVAIGAVSSLTTKAAEKAPNAVIPYQGKTKPGIVLALLLTASLARAGVALYMGDLAAVDFPELAQLSGEAFVAALSAAGGYALLKRKPKA